MHIAFLVYRFDPARQLGGDSVYAAISARSWVAAGHEVTLLSGSPDGSRVESLWEGVRIVSLPAVSYPGIFLDKARVRMLGAQNARAIYYKQLSQAAYEFLDRAPRRVDLVETSSNLAWSFHKHSRIPWALRVPGISELESTVDPLNRNLKAPMIFEMESIALQSSLFTSTMTEFMKVEIEKRGGRVDLVLTTPFDEVRCHEGERLPYTLVSVGRVMPGKGVATAIRVVKELGASWKLKIIGPDWMDASGTGHVVALRELSRQLGVEGQVEFVGPLPRDQTLKAIAESEFLILDSKVDNMPNVLIEAMMLGTKVVVSDVGGIPETVGVDGNIVPMGHVDGFVRAIQSGGIPLNADRRQSIAGRFNPAAIQARLEAAYRPFLKMNG